MKTLKLNNQKKKNEDLSNQSNQSNQKQPNKIIKVLDTIIAMIAFLLLIWLTVFLTDKAIEFFQGLFI